MLLAIAAIIAAVMGGTAQIILATRTGVNQQVIVNKLKEAANTQEEIHTSVNSNFSNLVRQLYAAVAIIIGLVIYTFWNLRHMQEERSNGYSSDASRSRYR